MNKLFNKLWNEEFTYNAEWKYKGIFWLTLFIGLLYVTAETLLIGIPGHDSLNIFNIFKKFGEVDPNARFVERNFTTLWIGVALFCFAVRITVILWNYANLKRINDKSFIVRNLYNYSISFAIALMVNMFIIYGLTQFASLLGVGLIDEGNVIDSAVATLNNFIETYVPTLVNIHSIPIVIILSVLLAGLPNYVIHRMSHEFRLLWLVFHRPHHCPEFLYPLSNPPAFMFDFVFILPQIIIRVGIAKLFYFDALTHEFILYGLIVYSLEIFNHSSILYKTIYSNVVIRNLCRITGHGVYHLVHHSAFLQDQNVNLGNGPFNFWDRLFRTYRKPYAEPPPFGLTDNPKIHLNPLRIAYGGISQILYELKWNKSWKDRFKIIFGGVYYIPRKTKDYIKIDGVMS